MNDHGCPESSSPKKATEGIVHMVHRYEVKDGRRFRWEVVLRQPLMPRFFSACPLSGRAVASGALRTCYRPDASKPPIAEATYVGGLEPGSASLEFWVRIEYRQVV